MKTIVYALLVAAVVSSCSSGNDVVHNGLIQKRKFRSGYHLNMAKHSFDRAEKTVPQPATNVDAAGAREGEKVTELVAPHEISNHTLLVQHSQEEPSAEAKHPRQGQLMRSTIKKALPAAPVSEIIAPAKPTVTDHTQGKGDLTGDYQRKGRIALLCSLALLILPYFILTLFLAGSHILAVLLGAIAVTCLVYALWHGIRGFKYAKSARWAILTLLGVVVVYGAGVALFMFVL